MHDLEPFGLVVLLTAGALLLAVLSVRVSERFRVPTPVVFLVAAAIASDVFPRLGGLPLRVDERLVTVALIVILFDGGLQIGWRQAREAAAAIVWIGVLGTVVTAAAVALAAHLLLGFDWRLALLLGTALAPTDPATVFAVLGRREISGRTGTILKGEAGVNDPVGIALLVAILGTAGASGSAAVGQGLVTFAVQMTVGLAVGVAGGLALVFVMRHVPLPNESLYPARVLAGAAVVYGAASVLHGSGFLAVLLAGVVAGDARAPYKREIERFASGLGSIAEIVVFVVLGLTVDFHALLTSRALWQGLLLAALLVLVVRPVLVGVLSLPIRLATGERVFVLWAGLKGAVPILLGLFVLGEDLAGGRELYDVLVVVVLVSVLVQGGLVPWMADRCRVPMRNLALEPWSLGMRFRSEPSNLSRHYVAPGSAAEGTRLADLALGEDAWVSMVGRAGHLVDLDGDTVLEAGDEVLLIGRGSDRLEGLFARP